jgi:Domain of Unknown Function (DUF1080)
MMSSRTLTRYGVFAITVLVSLTLLMQSSGVAAQDEPAPAPTPDRAPSYERGAPAGALRLPGKPPAVGDLIAEDSLTFPGAIPGSITSPSGRNVGEFVGEGYIMKVTGRSRDDSATAAIAAVIPDLVVPDGEIRLDAKVVSGHERALLFFLIRFSADPPASYEVNLVPNEGFAMLGKSVPNEDKLLPLALRTDLRGRMSRDDWNEYAIRLDGQNIWILLNGEPILSGSDSSFDRGRVAFGLMRTGDKNDNAEVAAVFRNLRVSRLAAGQ